MLMMGLGMMGAASRPGATLGSSLFDAYRGASHTYAGAMDSAFRNTLAKQEMDQRQKQADREEKRAQREERQDSAVTAGRISRGISSSQDPVAYWNLVRSMPEVQQTLSTYGIDPNLATPEQLQIAAGQLADISRVGAPAQPQAPLQLKAIVDPQTGKPVLVPEELAIGAQPYSAPSVSVNLGQQGLSAVPSGYFRPDPSKPELKVEPGGPVDQAREKETAQTRTAGGYLSRMENAENMLGTYQPSAQDFVAANAVLSGNTIVASAANRAMSPDGQKFYQAAADWVRAKLRKESGAVIGAEEMQSEIRTYFPVPGDTQDVIKQKAQARSVATEAMRKAAGGSAEPEYTATGPNGERIIWRNGQWERL